MQEIGLANPNSTRGRCGCPGWLGDGGFVGINSGFNRADGCGVGRGSQRGGFGLKMSQMDILTTRGMVKSATPPACSLCASSAGVFEPLRGALARGRGAFSINQTTRPSNSRKVLSDIGFQHIEGCCYGRLGFKPLAQPLRLAAVGESLRCSAKLTFSKSQQKQWLAINKNATAKGGEDAFGAAGGDRTHDPWLRRPILYPLSYSRIEWLEL